MTESQADRDVQVNKIVNEADQKFEPVIRRSNRWSSIAMGVGLTSIALAAGMIFSGFLEKNKPESVLPLIATSLVCSVIYFLNNRRVQELNTQRYSYISEELDKNNLR